jgi:LacI family transcriptional regulator
VQPTQKDIARKLGISQYSVSHALNGSNSVSERTRKRVQKLAARIGYKLNSSARAVRRGCFGNIAMLISSELSRSTIPPDLLGAVHDALSERRLHLTLSKLSDGAVTRSDLVPHILTEARADGLLINYHKMIPPGMERIIADCRLPAIWLNCRVDHDCVRPDDFQASRRLTRHFIEQGHRRIAYIDMHCGFDHQPGDHYSQYDRFEGYLSAMEEAALEPRRIDGAGQMWQNRAIYEFWNLPRSGWLAKPDRPTALVAYGSTEIQPVMLAAQALGMRLPDDLAIGSFGDGPISVAGLRVPTMVIPQEEIGRRAVALLLERVKDPTRSLEPNVVPCVFDPNPTGPLPERISERDKGIAHN